MLSITQRMFAEKGGGSMTTQDVLDAIISTILDWDNQAIIYTETIPQGFARPSYFIDITQSEKTLMRTRLQREFSITIQFYPPKNNGARENALKIADQLSMILEWIDIDGRPRRFFDCQYHLLEDHTVKFECRYACHLMRQENYQKMQTLTKNIETNQ